MTTITGTAEADTLAGHGQDDLISGLSGADTVDGAAGNDRISGGEGRDTISGGAGDDVIFGHGASDTQAGSGDITATLVASGLSRPVFASSAPGDPDRLYVIEEHTGLIKILDPATGEIAETPFLDIPDVQLSDGNEQGLLGMAFHPDYENNGQFFVFLTNADGNIEVRRYERSAGNPDVADASSGDVILTIPHPDNANHNGGWLGFGPDGYLYVSVGDGGGGGDEPNNAQNTDVLLGKMLRIDVDGDDFAGDSNRDYAIPEDNPFVGVEGADEIWALGLRNAWRPSFDRLTGDFYIADVGQGLREEVNFQAAGSAGGGNYGWKVKEGTLIFDDTIPGNPPANSPELIDPVAEYAHVAAPNGGFSITGGYVYRGQSEGMQGVYFYADYVSHQMWSFRVVDGKAVDLENRTAQIVASGGSVNNISSFAEDGHGNLYVIGLDGEVFRLDPQAGAGDGADNLSGGTGNDRIYGGAGNDLLNGGTGDDRIDGGSQNDDLRGSDGIDILTGGTGNDTLRGGAGKDRQEGGDGSDIFVFTQVANSTPGAARDRIADFVVNPAAGTGYVDRIDLSAIDARAATGGNQEFSFIGSGNFSAEGQIRVVQKGDNTIVQVNTAGTGGAEMQIELLGVAATSLTAADFIL